MQLDARTQRCAARLHTISHAKTTTDRSRNKIDADALIESLGSLMQAASESIMDQRLLQHLQAEHIAQSSHTSCKAVLRSYLVPSAAGAGASDVTSLSCEMILAHET